jgi:alkylation response protein AidB-like acyl-CoA dehydrogenase
MELELTPEQKKLEREVYTYLKNVIPPEFEEERVNHIEGDGPICRHLIRKLGMDGWMGIGWPREYGGQGRTPIEQYIFFDLAMGYFRLPIPVLSLMTVGPTLMKVGSEAQKKKYLPGILTGDVIFSIGYTEPEAGTDLFSLKTRAVRQGDYYIINGEKIFTSMGHFCNYFWLAARTDPDPAKKHAGISIFIVDAKSPGLTIKPMPVMGGFRTNHEFFDNVKVPKECLVGEENKGFRYMLMQLAHERINLVPHSLSLRMIEDCFRWARESKLNGRPVIEQHWVRNRLAEMTVEAEVLKMLNYRTVWLMSKDVVPHVESAMSKAFGSEHIVRVAGSCLQIMGLYGQLTTASKYAPFNGFMERQHQMLLMLTFGGGTNEVMRDIIATMGLGMMKSR